MVGDHIYLNIGGIFSLKPFNLTGIAGGLLFISLSFDEPLLKQYNKKCVREGLTHLIRVLIGGSGMGLLFFSVFLIHPSLKLI